MLLTLVLWGSWQTCAGNYPRCGIPTPPQTTNLGQRTEKHAKPNELDFHCSIKQRLCPEAQISDR